MTEWTVVGVLVTIIGLFFTVGAPVLKLNKNIVELTMTMKAQGEDIKRNAAELEDQKKHAHESHQKLWEHNAAQDKQLTDHETRIKVLEEKE